MRPLRAIHLLVFFVTKTLHGPLPTGWGPEDETLIDLDGWGEIATGDHAIDRGSGTIQQFARPFQTDNGFHLCPRIFPAES